MSIVPRNLTDLAAGKLGGLALGANDEFFAEKENLLKAEPPIFIDDKYTEFGKWMDGWETKRKREESFDWCVIKLGLPGFIASAGMISHDFSSVKSSVCTKIFHLAFNGTGMAFTSAITLIDIAVSTKVIRYFFISFLLLYVC